MTPAEEGAYIRLLCIAWNSNDCGLPDDDKELAVLSRLNEGWFNGSSTKIRKCFKKRGGRLFNLRLLSERKKQAEWRRKSREGGLKSGKSRKNKDKDTNHPSQMVPTKDEPKGNTSSTSSSSSIKKEYNGEFDTLWKAYGYSRSKQGSIKAFTKAIKEGTLKIPEDMTMLLKAITDYRKYLTTVDSDQAHLSSWINGKRWEDEYGGDKPKSILEGAVNRQNDTTPN
jgi:uncharacterized protein YdaU (DUF1376 family)